MMNLSTKFEVSVYTHYEDMKGNTKFGFGVARSHLRSREELFDGMHTSSCYLSIVTVSYCAPFLSEILVKNSQF